MRAEQKSRETPILSLRVREKVTLTQTRTVTEKEPQYGRKVQTRNRRDRKTHKDRNYSGRLTRLNYRVVYSRNFIQLLLRNCHRDSQIQGTNSTVYRETHLQSQKCKQGYTKSKEEKTQNSKVERDTNRSGNRDKQ
jgi:hypothetical protein